MPTKLPNPSAPIQRPLVHPAGIGGVLHARADLVAERLLADVDGAVELDVATANGAELALVHSEALLLLAVLVLVDLHLWVVLEGPPDLGLFELVVDGRET